MNQKQHPVSSLSTGKMVLLPELVWERASLPRVSDRLVVGPTEFGILAGPLKGKNSGPRGRLREDKLEKNPQKHIY